MRAKHFIKELSYPGNIGMMELMKFQKIATPEEKTRMKLLLSTDKKAAWDLLQQVTGTKLQSQTLDEEELFEIDMSPSSLKKLAAETGAMGGMEFEMVVPDVSNADADEDEMEPDYDSDDRVSSFEGIEDFFADLDYNTRNEARRLVQKIREEYLEWATERQMENWQEEKYKFFKDLMRDEEFDFVEARETAAEELGLKPDSDSIELDARVEELLDEYVDEQWEEQGKLHNGALERWLEEEPLPDETDFFEEEGMRWMSDVQQQYSGDIAWPYYRYVSSGGVSLGDLGEEFSDMIGKPVNVAQSYHGALRKPGEYSLEPDSSIRADDSRGGGGAEFVTPPMPIDELIDDLKKTIAWGKKRGAYTNDSTGLHMNISIPGKNMTYLDFTKLALLLGDEYVLEQFGREANSYTESAMKKIRSRLRSDPESIKRVMDEMRRGMNALATRAIANTDGFGKYTSINPKDGYVEFRSPGGDWMDSNIDQLTNTLLRFVVALDAALDPEKYRKEYLKKLYQLLSPSSNEDPIAYFAKYSAGLLPQSALKNILKGFQTQRQYKKDVASGTPTGKQWWKVTIGTYGVEVVASSEEEALITGGKEYGLPEEAIRTMIEQQKIKAVPVRPYETQEQRLYHVRPVTDSRHLQEIVVRASSPEEAYRKAQVQKPNVFGALRKDEVAIMPTRG